MGSLVQEQVPPLARLIRGARAAAETYRSDARTAKDSADRETAERCAEVMDHDVRRLTRRIFEGL